MLKETLIEAPWIKALNNEPILTTIFNILQDLWLIIFSQFIPSLGLLILGGVLLKLPFEIFQPFLYPLPSLFLFGESALFIVMRGYPSMPTYEVPIVSLLPLLSI